MAHAAKKQKYIYNKNRIAKRRKREPKKHTSNKRRKKRNARGEAEKVLESAKKRCYLMPHYTHNTDTHTQTQTHIDTHTHIQKHNQANTLTLSQRASKADWEQINK